MGTTAEAARRAQGLPTQLQGWVPINQLEPVPRLRGQGFSSAAFLHLLPFSCRMHCRLAGLCLNGSLMTPSKPDK